MGFPFPEIKARVRDGRDEEEELRNGSKVRNVLPVVPLREGRTETADADSRVAVRCRVDGLKLKRKFFEGLAAAAAQQQQQDWRDRSREMVFRCAIPF